VCDQLTTNKVAQQEFTKWGYGQSIIAQALLEVTSEIDGLDYSTWVNQVYSEFLKKDGNAYALAFNLTADVHSIPRWSKGIGDIIGLPPFGFLYRSILYNDHPDLAPKDYSGATDLAVAVNTADQYVVPFQHHFKDGVVSRNTSGTAMRVTWPDDSTNPFVWGDDTFMGLTLISRLIRGGHKKQAYIDMVAKQMPLFVEHLDPKDPDGLYYHGQDAHRNIYTCCKWGRANGW
jgi:hypothetical protein